MPGETVDIDQLLDRQVVGARQALVVVPLLVLVLFTNFTLQVMAMTAPAMAAEWGLQASAFAAPMAAGWLGAAFGCVVGGMLGDRAGRRISVIAMGAIAGAATFATGFIHDTVTLFALRALAGFGLGGLFPPALALLTECLPTRFRGLAVSASMICGPIGISACAMYSSAVIPAHGWALPFFTGGGALLAVALVLCFTLPESPRYLAHMPGRRAALAAALRRIGVALDPAVEIAVPPKPEQAALAAVFSGRFRGPTIRVWICFFSTFLIIAALLSWLPTILMSIGYSAAAGGEAISAWSLGGIAGTLLSGAILARWGARKLGRALPLLVIACLLALTVLPLGPDAGSLVLLAPLFIVGLALSGLMTALFAYVAGFYPAEIRSTGVGMADMVGRATSVIASYISVFLLDRLGFHGFFVALAVVAVFPVVLLTARGAPPTAG